MNEAIFSLISPNSEDIWIKYPVCKV